MEVGNDVIQDLAEQPSLYYRAALAEARLKSALEFSERQLRGIEIRIADQVVSSYAQRDEDLTKEQITARVVAHVEVIKETALVGKTRRRLFLAKALRAAYEQRATVLLALAKTPTDK